LSTFDKPFLSGFNVSDAPKEVYRWSFGASLDWRLGARDVVSVAGQWNHFDTTPVNSTLQFDAIGSRAALPVAFGPDFTESAAGATRLTNTVVLQHKVGSGYNLRLTHRHTGPVWKGESGGAYSASVSRFLGAEDSAMRAVTARLPNVSVRFDGITDSRPKTITVRSATGAVLNYASLANYTLESATLAPSRQQSVTTSAFANLSRAFAGRVPLLLKTGFDVRREDRDFRNPSESWTFVGPDRAAGSADDRIGLYDLVSAENSRVPLPFGYGRIERLSNHKVYDLLQAHPEYFLKNDANAISSAATQSRKLTESVAAGYIRGDLSLFDHRLKLVGGVRYERTFNDGYGVLNDIGATYQRDSAGRIVRNAAGQPVRLAGDAAALARLQFKDRGARGKRNYGGFYPSLNATQQITEKLILRGAFAQTLTRPELSNIVPSTTATDPSITTGTPTITVSNSALKPWSSRSYDLALEYYFDKPGIISVGVFRKDIRDFFSLVRLQSTPALLAEYGFDESYSNYQIVTQGNSGGARVSGIEFEYRQTLTFLPAWASGVAIFANGTSLHLEGARTADFSGFIRRSTNWGVSLSRPRYTVKLNWNQRGRQRLAPVSGLNVPEGTFQYRNPRLFLDINVEWRITKYAALFASVRNVTDVAWRDEVYGAATPAYARGNNWVQYGAQGIFGVKGSF